MRTLILNAGYEPLAVVNFRRAMVLVMKGRASVVLSDEENPVLTVFGDLERPSVIILTRYVKIPYQKAVPVTRRGVLRRDANRCGYCGHHATTIDHIQPKSRGGADSWQNLVACCQQCNNAKSDRTLKELGWTLLREPFAPRGVFWMVPGVENSQPEWNEFLTVAA